jgi:hypothetical protein
MGTSTLLTEKETELLLDLLMYQAQTDTENSKAFFSIANKIDEIIVELGFAEPETELAEPDETEME